MTPHDTTITCAVCRRRIELDVGHVDEARELLADVGWACTVADGRITDTCPECLALVRLLADLGKRAT